MLYIINNEGISIECQVYLMLNERKIQDVSKLQEIKEFFYKKDTPDAARLYLLKIPETVKDFLLLAYALYKDKEYFGRKINFFVPGKSMNATAAYPYRLKCAESMLQEKVIPEAKEPECLKNANLLLEKIKEKLNKYQIKEKALKSKETNYAETLFYQFKRDITAELKINIKPDNKNDIDRLARVWSKLYMLEKVRGFFGEQEVNKVNQRAADLKKEISELTDKLTKPNFSFRIP